MHSFLKRLAISLPFVRDLVKSRSDLLAHRDTILAEKEQLSHELAELQSKHDELHAMTKHLAVELSAGPTEAHFIQRQVSDAPRIAYVSVVKNEEERIYFHLNYYRNLGIRDFFLCNHGSTDGTRDLISRFASENPDLTIVELFDPTPGHYQGARMTALADLAYSSGCNWILPVDADEILQSKSDTWGLHELLSHPACARAEFGHVYIPVLNYLPTPGDKHDVANPFLKLSHREKQCSETWPPKVLIKWCRGMLITEGNHDVLRISAEIRVPENPLYHAHFPYISIEQVRKRIVKGGLAYQETPEFRDKGEMDWHWSEAYAQYQVKGEQLLEEMFHSFYEKSRELAYQPLDPAAFESNLSAFHAEFSAVSV